MMRGPVSVPILGILFLSGLSGCVGTDASPESSPSDVAAPSDAAGRKDVGVIEGAVLSDEAMPIVGAKVALFKPISLEATTNDAGQFRFESLDPGSYSIHAGALGYESSARAVEVVAGETTEVRFMLATVEVSQEPIIVTIPRVFMIHLDVSGQLAYHYPTQQFACDPCQSYQTIKPGPKGGRVEMDFTPTASQCGTVGCRIGFRVNANPNNDTTGGATLGGTTVISGNMIPRQNRTISDEGIKALKNVERTAFRVNGYDVIVEQKVFFYVSLSYNAPIPDEFSALPPK